MFIVMGRVYLMSKVVRSAEEIEQGKCQGPHFSGLAMLLTPSA
jgi:hypothetical protein